MQPGDSNRFEEFAKNWSDWVDDAVDESFPHSGHKQGSEFDYRFDSGSATFHDPFYDATQTTMAPERKSAEERANNTKIGPRPKHWPHHIAWPPASVREAWEQMTKVQREQVMKGLQERADSMRERAQQVHEWLVSNDSRPRRNYPIDHPSYGVMFAALLNPKGVDSVLSGLVLAWEHDRVTTQDGGIVRASETGVRAVKITPQAAMAMVLEARARGWGSIEITGSKEFKRLVAAAAAQHGMTVYSRGLLGKRTVMVSGNVPPAKDMEFKRPPRSGPSGRAGARPQPENFSTESIAMAPVMAAMHKTRGGEELPKPKKRPRRRPENDPHGPKSGTNDVKSIDHDPDEDMPRPNGF